MTQVFRTSRYIYFLLFLGISFFSIHSISAGGWVESDCSYHSAELKLDIFGAFPYVKELGTKSLCLRQDITVFKGKTITPCGMPGNQSWIEPDNADPGLPGDYKPACHKFTVIPGIVYYTDGACNHNDPDTGNCDGWDQDPHTPYRRIFELKEPPYNQLVDGALFKPGAFGFSKNAECNPGSITPVPGLKVSKLKQSTYKWDNEPPVCSRGIGAMSIHDGPFYDDITLNQAVTSGEDGTLKFFFTGDPYDGKWTNLDIEGTWYCADRHSGCKNINPIYSGPLWHYQTMHTPSIDRLTDIVENTPLNTNPPGDDFCDSNFKRPSNISRSCIYTLGSSYIDASELSSLQLSARHTLDGSYPNDYTYVNGLKSSGAFPAGGSAAFAQVVKNLRDISKANFGDYHKLYWLHDGSCKYTPSYDGNPLNNHPPLIDKIKPVVTFEFSGKELINNETNILDNSKTFLAGRQTFNLRFEDSFESNYRSNPRAIWEHWNGISGLDSVHFTLKRIKTHNNIVVDDMIFDSYVDTSFTLVGNHNGWRQYNQTGSIQNIPHYAIFPGVLDETSEIVKTGLYEFEYSISDYAGNENVGTVRFRIYPNAIDPDKTSFKKIDPMDAKINYEMSGSTTNVWKNVLPNMAKYYANASDVHEYIVSLFDKYGNPAYSRTVSDIQLDDTNPSQISLDVLHPSADSAIYVSNSKLHLTPGASTDMSGSFSMYTSSYRPGNFRERYLFTTCTWTDDYIETGCIVGNTVPNTPEKSETGTFLHIFTGAIDLFVGKRIDLGTNNNVRMDTYITIDRDPILSSFTLENFMESLRADSPGFNITAKGGYNGVRSAPYYVSDKFAFSTFIPEQITAFENINVIKIYSAPLLHLDITGIGGLKNIRYYLVATESDFGSGITYGTGQLNRIYVEGNKSSKGKEGYVNPTKNIAQINSSEVRNLIRKNIGVLTRNRAPGTSPLGSIVNRVKYLRGSDYTLSELTDIDDWDTLIVEKGNLIIDADFNIEKKRKGIIVLGEENGVGQIFIKPNVQFIGATIFSENSIQSVDAAGGSIVNSNSDRALLLSNQLVFFGGVYSKNTIGGAVRAGSSQEYLIPWNDTTTSLDTAVKYDLAFLRMNNFGAKTAPLHDDIDSTKSLNKNRLEFVVILYDERNLTDPLPGFAIDKK